MREAGPCGACAVLCSRQRGQTSPELAHFWALGVWLRLGSAQASTLGTPWPRPLKSLGHCV